MTRVAAVVVTFNRKALVTECLKRLFEQTRPLDRVYIIDNCSTDGTAEHLRALDMLDRPDVAYVRLESNSGGAGGFHEGMRRAYEDGFDWIWIMDDDGEPAADALALMEPHFDDPGVAALLPMIADATGAPDFDGTHRGFLKARADMHDNDVARPLKAEDIAGRDTVDIDFYSFVGPCFPRRVIDAIGLPRPEFFIHYDDVDYVRRLSRVGRSVVVIAARILHREVQNAGLLEEREAIGRRRMRMRYDRLWLRYFGYRNLTYLILSGRIDAPKLPIFTRHAKLVIGILLYDDRKWRRLRFWNGALIDGMLGRFDNAKPARILGKR